MSDKEPKFQPISVSADGRRNSYSRRCDVLGQVMNYAACLWRQEVLSKPDIRTPADWAPCSDAARCGRCHAVEMRKEEVLKGYAIYLNDREEKQPRQAIGSSGRSWVMPELERKDHTVRSAPASAPAPQPRPAPVARPAPSARPASVIEAMGSASGYADALNAMTPTATAAAPPEPKVTTAPPLPSPPKVQPAAPLLSKIDMLPGESPLAYARRLRAAQTPV